MEFTIGFIGSGNMAAAMIGGLIKAKTVAPIQLLISDLDTGKLAALKSEYGLMTTEDNEEVAKKANILFLAVKPHQYEAVISQIKAVVDEQTIVVSIAAGQSIAAIEKAFGKKIKLVRSMPNTPALVGAGMSALMKNEHISDDEMNQVISVFKSFGSCEVVSESLIDSVIAVSGSSPAYVYLFIESMADAAVWQGMPREQAYRFAAQAVLGAAKMVLETEAHPGSLKDAVCSPGGTTIAAVIELEKSGMRASVIKAMEACVNQSRSMQKKGG